jgi:hypothetical protein
VHKGYAAVTCCVHAKVRPPASTAALATVWVWLHQCDVGGLAGLEQHARTGTVTDVQPEPGGHRRCHGADSPAAAQPATHVVDARPPDGISAEQRGIALQRSRLDHIACSSPDVASTQRASDERDESRAPVHGTRGAASVEVPWLLDQVRQALMRVLARQPRRACGSAGKRER